MTKSTFKMLDGAKAIDTAIKSIGTRGKTLQRDIHIAAVSTLNHKNALRDWFIAMGKFSYDATDKTLTFNKKGITQLDTAIATPFWEFKQEAAYVPFDLQAAILTLVKRADKAMQHGDKVDKAALAQLAALAGVSTPGKTDKTIKPASNVRDVLAA